MDPNTPCPRGGCVWGGVIHLSGMSGARMVCMVAAANLSCVSLSVDRVMAFLGDAPGKEEKMQGVLLSLKQLEKALPPPNETSV